MEQKMLLKDALNREVTVIGVDGNTLIKGKVVEINFLSGNVMITNKLGNSNYVVGLVYSFGKENPVILE
jgi:hypothetical protein